MTDPITITVYAVGYSSYGQLYDVLLVRRSAQPLLAACRILLREGVDPATPVEMRHEGADGYLRSTVGIAAALTVRDDRVGKPVFERWKPSPWDAKEAPAVAPPVRFSEPAATQAQEAA